MNEFRKKLLHGAQPAGPLLRGKQPKPDQRRAAEEESFADLSIPRTASRVANHRGGDRHRLESEQAQLIHDGEVSEVSLINLSGGGAMIEGANRLRLWDQVELQLGSISRLEAVVRWIKGDRAGLEFAHETRIEGCPDEVADTLRDVIRRSFPDVALEEAARRAVSEADSPPETIGYGDEQVEEHELAEISEREVRHPLIWSGLVHFNHDSTPIRLRNISSGGALIECSEAFPVGAELLLDLGEAGAIFASVHWAHGDQAGLKFHTPYEVSALAKARPEVAGAHWVAPDYLREDRSANSPWAQQWGRSDLASLHRGLELRRSRLRR
jgi:hypothetical protein